MMVDYLTVELPDAVRVPVNGGHVAKVRPDGSVEWATACRRDLRGSWSSNMTVRAIASSHREGDGKFGHTGRKLRESGLELQGNPAKFLSGHNLFGSDCVVDLLDRTLASVLPAIYPDLPELPRIDVREGRVARIDLTGSWLLDRESDVLPTLRAMEERIYCPYRGRGVQRDIGTLYYGLVDKGKRAKAWQLKLYAKGLEVMVHKLPQPAYGVDGLMDELKRTIRVELTLRTEELKRLGMSQVSDWTRERVRAVWEQYVGKLDFSDGHVNLDVNELAAAGIKHRLRDAIAAWKSGNDMRVGRSPATFSRLRKQIREATGYDIATVMPKSNVVPLRRVVELVPATRPAWADQLDRVLREAA